MAPGDEEVAFVGITCLVLGISLLYFNKRLTESRMAGAKKGYEVLVGKKNSKSTNKFFEERYFKTESF